MRKKGHAMQSRLALACVTPGVPGVAAADALRRSGRPEESEVLAAGEADERRQAGQQLEQEKSPG